MTVYTVWHFLMHRRCMRFTMTGPALRYAWMFCTMTESTGEILMLGCGFLHICRLFFMARSTESPRCSHGRSYLQRVMSRMATKAITCNLSRNMWFMTLGTIRNLAMYFMTEGTGFFGMRGLVIGEILARSFMAGQTRFLDIIGKMQGQRLMGVGVT